MSPMLQSLAQIAMLCCTREICPLRLFIPPLQRCSQLILIPWRTRFPPQRTPLMYTPYISRISCEGTTLCGITIRDCPITRSLQLTHVRDGQPRRMIPEIYASSVSLLVICGLTFRTWPGLTSIQDSLISLAVTTRSWTTSSAQRCGLTAAHQRLPSLMILAQYNRPGVDPRWHHILRRSSSMPTLSQLLNNRYRRIRKRKLCQHHNNREAIPVPRTTRENNRGSPRLGRLQRDPWRRNREFCGYNSNSKRPVWLQEHSLSAVRVAEIRKDVWLHGAIHMFSIAV